MFGTSAKYLDALKKAGLKPRADASISRAARHPVHRLAAAPESFDYVYEDVKRDVQLSSISGGTDIISCFVLGNPTGPV